MASPIRFEGVPMEKKRILLAATFCLLAFTLTALAAGPGFSGTWILDKSKSEGLSGPRGGVESIMMTVTQDGKQLAVKSKQTMEGGQESPEQSFSYNVDGSESKADIGGRMPMKATLKAHIADDKAELSQERTGDFNGNQFTMTLKEKWELSDGGKVLTIHRTTDTPRGSREATLVFNRQ